MNKNMKIVNHWLLASGCKRAALTTGAVVIQLTVDVLMATVMRGLWLVCVNHEEGQQQVNEEFFFFTYEAQLSHHDT